MIAAAAIFAAIAVVATILNAIFIHIAKKTGSKIIMIRMIGKINHHPAIVIPVKVAIHAVASCAVRIVIAVTDVVMDAVAIVVIDKVCSNTFTFDETGVKSSNGT